MVVEENKSFLKTVNCPFQMNLDFFPSGTSNADSMHSGAKELVTDLDKEC